MMSVDKNSQELSSNCRELDREYSPSAWCRGLSPDESIELYLQLSIEESNKFVKGLGFKAHLDVPYGKKEREKVDIFTPLGAKEDAPVFIFLHGGYWQHNEVNKENNSLVAAPLLNKGVVVVIVDYGCAPQDTIPEMIQQTKEATILIANKFPETRGLYIAGHSAGGHLVATLLSVDWSSLHGGRRNLIKGILPISGVFDLRPLVNTYVNKPLCLTESSAAEVSPMLVVDSIPQCNIGIKVRLPYAEYDPPSFHKQSQDYCKLLTARGMDASFCKVKGRDHFQEITELPDENCALQQIFQEIIIESD